MKSAPYSGDGQLRERKTRTVHYRLNYNDAPYPDDVELRRALDKVRTLLSTSSAVSQYFAKTYNNDVHQLWFEGRPGPTMRALRVELRRLLLAYSPRWVNE